MNLTELFEQKVGVCEGVRADAIIPETLMAKLLLLRPELTRQGVVQMHHGTNRAPSFRLRYRIRQDDKSTVHRSLELGSAAVATAVGELLKKWRAASSRPERNKRVPRILSEAEKRNRVFRRLVRRMARESGGGRPFQEKMVKQYDRAMNGSIQELKDFTLGEPYLRAPKRGRPRKSRLW